MSVKTTAAPAGNDQRLAAILTTLDLLQEPDAITELRALDVDGRDEVWFGYFDSDHRTQLAEAATRYDGRAGLYITLNRIHSGLLARSPNRLTRATKKSKTTSDRDVLWRRWLPVDVDPIRPAGISSTDEERTCALQAARECWQYLKTRGWPEQIVADSGNGYHLLFKIDLPNDALSERLVKSTLEALAARFNNSRVEIDAKNFNAARIWKLYGTLSHKGASLADRPHRPSKLMHNPEATQ